MFGWLTQVGSALDRAFERRLRRASGLDAPQHAAPVPDIAGPPDDGDVEIANLARGATIAPANPPLAAVPPDDSSVPQAPALPPAPVLPPSEPQPSAPSSATQAPQTEADEAEIVNLPPGSTT
ncbi:MAG TPA: hypothetical protein VFT99_03745 [Roseiflexaceae bacterium]|nr:hypothetical protein [Roseiflexaceae bacterium]